MSEMKEVFHTDGETLSEQTWKNDDGNLHREDGPAQIYYDENGNVTLEIWFEDGKRHRLDGPAGTVYDENENIEEKLWFENDNQHRLNGPANIEYDKQGNVTEKRWYEYGKCHRLNEPAIIVYDDKGNVTEEIWFKEEKRHRLDGPAYFNVDGSKPSIQATTNCPNPTNYFIDGEPIDEDKIRSTFELNKSQDIPCPFKKEQQIAFKLLS
jgi:hypothetical protein